MSPRLQYKLSFLKISMDRDPPASQGSAPVVDLLHSEAFFSLHPLIIPLAVIQSLLLILSV